MAPLMPLPTPASTITAMMGQIQSCFFRSRPVRERLADSSPYVMPPWALAGLARRKKGVNKVSIRVPRVTASEVVQAYYRPIDEVVLSFRTRSIVRGISAAIATIAIGGDDGREGVGSFWRISSGPMVRFPPPKTPDPL